MPLIPPTKGNLRGISIFSKKSWQIRGGGINISVKCPGVGAINIEAKFPPPGLSRHCAYRTLTCFSWRMFQRHEVTTTQTYYETRRKFPLLKKGIITQIAKKALTKHYPLSISVYYCELMFYKFRYHAS